MELLHNTRAICPLGRTYRVRVRPYGLFLLCADGNPRHHLALAWREAGRFWRWFAVGG